MPDGAGHRIGFLQAGCIPGFRQGLRPVPIPGTNIKKIQLCAVERFFVSPAAFCHSEKDSRAFQF